jgi:hypothetical protein
MFCMKLRTISVPVMSTKSVAATVRVVSIPPVAGGGGDANPVCISPAKVERASARVIEPAVRESLRYFICYLL